MSRAVARLLLAVLMLGLLPAAASAQRDNRYTREATKFIGLAMTRQAEAQRADMYRLAMVQLRDGMQVDPDNAKVWLLAGQVLAALGEVRQADAAFNKAEALHPPYADEIAGEREAAWMEFFKKGIAAMNRERYTEAIQLFEGAHLLYSERPEGLMNLGALYANFGENEKAVMAFREAIKATQGPLAERLDPDTREAWSSYREMAEETIAVLLGGG
jgi:tetratricopeptide (TPR) repeat protein